MYNILICDDERDIVNALKIYLSAENYKLFEAFNGNEALKIVKQQDIHLIIMDIMMPQMDGITAMVEMRKEKNIPVILLTAKSEDNDKVLGLNVGADDYITKPFNPMEVLARVKSQLRRYTQLGSVNLKENQYVIGSLYMDDISKQVMVDGDKVSLTPTEYEILKLMLSEPGKVFSTKEIYNKVWNTQFYGTDSTVAVHIRHLREKIEINPAEPKYIKVVWGQGYKIERE